MNRRAILLLTGEQNSGKTSVCLRVARLLKAQRWDVAGIISTGTFEQDMKVLISAQSLRSRERRPLAARIPTGGTPSGPRTERWSFDASTLAWGNAILEAAVPCEALVVDEIGPLEFTRGQGWTSALPAVDSGGFRLALVVVRRSLLDFALRRWPAAETHLIRQPNEIEAVADRIVAHGMSLRTAPAVHRGNRSGD